MALPPDRHIEDLPSLVDALAPAEAERFRRIYHVGASQGHLRLTQEMLPWVERTFGDPAGVERQTLVRVDNLVTGEGSLFNPLRGRRPVRVADEGPSLTEALASDPWSDPLVNTPEDPFGRLSNEHGVTAANVAKFDAAHSLVVFDEPNPLSFTQDSLVAHLDLARRWLEAAHAEDAEACYPYVVWNCLWRSGGSIVHGHLQMALARGRHYARIERARRDAVAYEQAHGARYFEDLLRVHGSMGLALGIEGVPVLAHLTPLKEREVMILAGGLDAKLAGAIHAVLRTFRDALGVRSFNVGIALPPLAQAGESWAGFPAVVRIVDRGDLASRTSDFGAMELYAQSVIASDPFDVARALGA